VNAEDALRAALHARSEDFVPSPGAWADNRARVRRRVRARRVTVSVAAAAAVVLTGAVAVAWPRPERVAVVPGASSSPPASPSAAPSGTVSPSPAPRHAFHAPDLRGMAPAEARALAERCVESFQDPVQEMPDAGLDEPAEDYRLIYVLPSNADRERVHGHVVALHAGNELLECRGTLSSPGVAHWDTVALPWLELPVAGGVDRGGSDGSWSGSGRYTAEVARVEVEPIEGDPRVDAFLDNGFWFASGTATGSTLSGGLRDPYPRVRGYGHDGTLLYDSATRGRGSDCYVLADGSHVDWQGKPTTATPCRKAYLWP
jgi:hypothetical protein